MAAPMVRTAPESITPESSQCEYTKCYCEENVWKLCEHILHHNLTELSKCYSVFVSNDNKSVPIWKQQASNSIESPVVWDYHVIMLRQDITGSSIYDLDTRLDFPCTFEDYALKALGADIDLHTRFHRFFRVVPATVYLEKFASDRSHMINKGAWMAPPPSYPCIQTAESSNNIEDFISMDASVGYGEVMDLSEFIQTYGHTDLKLKSLIR